MLAVSSIYGIDILQDNVEACRKRLFDLFESKYKNLYKESYKEDCLNSVKYLLDHNIICGDALTLQTIGKNPKPIIFSEWSPVNGNMMKRRDFSYGEMMDYAELGPLMESVLDAEGFLPEPVKDYPLVHFLRLSDDYK